MRAVRLPLRHAPLQRPRVQSAHPARPRHQVTKKCWAPQLMDCFEIRCVPLTIVIQPPCCCRKKIFFYPSTSDVDREIIAYIESNGGRNDITAQPMWVGQQRSGSWNFFACEVLTAAAGLSPHPVFLNASASLAPEIVPPRHSQVISCVCSVRGACATGPHMRTNEGKNNSDASSLTGASVPRAGGTRRLCHCV